MGDLKHIGVTIAELRAAYPALAAVAEGTLKLPPVDPETAEWLDGPWFCKWIAERGMTSARAQLSVPLQRLHSKWTGGEPVSLESADEIVTRLGYHLRDLPDEMWVRPPCEMELELRSMRVPDAARADAVKRLQGGESRIELAAELGVHPDTLSNWARRAA